MHRVLAFVFLVAAAACCFATTFVIFGLCLMFAMVLTAAGLGVPHPTLIAPVATLAQFIAYWFVRDKELPGLHVTRADDTGELLIMRPDKLQQRLGWYDQADGYSVWRSAASVVLATPIAAAQAWRHWKRSRFVARTDREGLATLAAYLLSRMERASLAEIQHDLPELDLEALLPRLDTLPGFNIMASEPQGISLTDSGQEVLLAAVPG